MNIQSEKIKLAMMLLATDNESIVKSVKALFSKQNERISIKKYNKELAEAEKRIKKGAFVSHDDLKKEAAKW